ncbi:hypothetical protein ACFCYN_11655 [Gottfriedia sp. NPDC056225]|uniref:hypothetical protein n=1 Tax=Bacillaceae TaxID=186817 RepID=UPI000BF0E588|nr:hypothetical protein [Bacillus sp. AFS002410]PEJ56961.1 hypothetical protein CN692_15390 [Bacillus sp. AFS002410]
MKKRFEYLLIKFKWLDERGIYLPYTIFMINLLLVFFLIQVDIFQSIHTFYSYTISQNNLERAHIQAIYELKSGEIPFQSNTIKYYNNTKIVWNFSLIANDEYHVTLTSSNSNIKKHVVQFNYKKNSNQVFKWID